MKLCLSNLAWDAARNEELYEFMNAQGICALEIAPTKLFGANPYDCLSEAKEYADRLRTGYAISIVSMQSLWFGKNERIFASQSERDELLCYTKRSVDFAAEIGCRNLVFGCPKNRVIGSADNMPTAIEFFGSIGRYAHERGVVFALEPNPEIYSTDFLNTTDEALDFCRFVDCEGLKVNLDFGTVIANEESVVISNKDISYINHVHLSEPYLVPIKKRETHRGLREALEHGGYNSYISVEMGKSERDDDIIEAALYLKEVFG